MSDKWLSIAPIDSRWSTTLDLAKTGPFDLGEGITVQLIPEWFRSHEMLDSLLSFSHRDAIQNSARYVLVAEYEAAGDGAPDPAWKGASPRSLQETALTDAALPKLADLQQLEMLNLHTTGVTDAGIQALRSLANLKRPYVWQTKVTPTGAANLRAGLPNVDIELGD